MKNAAHMFFDILDSDHFIYIKHINNYHQNDHSVMYILMHIISIFNYLLI